MPFFLDEKPIKQKSFDDRGQGDSRGRGRNARSRGDRPERGGPRSRRQTAPNDGMARFRLEVGRQHGVKPGNIIGCIANEAGLDGEFIQKLNIEDNFSTVDLPADMPKALVNELKGAWVCGQQLKIAPVKEGGQVAKRRLKPRKK